ncbi:putative ensconsin-like [Cocos nucifera]|uniref:Putative ensconsin-like n=1 Tax=Cocos nucifera TaxID=13894 RepID=A0A8K0IMX4_COCNU|nr:putative ensconsin-like [Cocos nucifera]
MAGEGSKKARVDILSSATPANATATPKVADGVEVIPTAEVGTTDGAIVPPTSTSPPAEVQVLELPIGGEKREKKKEKKKLAIVKIRCKAQPIESNDGNEDLKENFFYNRNIIRDLVDKFALPEVLGHQLLAHIKMVNCLRSEALKAQKDHQVEVNRLQEEKATEVYHLTKEKDVEVRILQDVLKKEEQTSVGLKAALALEEEKRKKVEIEIVELKV